ncbi:prolipoprotein diacylglyceryl transferase [Burkholderia thailandensis]|nr:prolipoprotein diacylglyceryl transferase [Burkholderia thailandensis]MDD1489034.1 prolipoprotein diacylglyceryl transferase [Burkholderia thailandensis]MDD1495380.1 prolipoprotein diacylglyceryl transferase [Burkholderia thailandensis]TBW55396.1 prolipoprotein diacylglyceryl transferase [Burkholderia thailandensis]TGB31739.1 prolipoprotein diacylglyceryl transferase [Burkholderia thailandensis]
MRRCGRERSCGACVESRSQRVFAVAADVAGHAVSIQNLQR